jgi:transcription antitermination factor NusG
MMRRLSYDHRAFKIEHEYVRCGKICHRLWPAFPRYIFVLARRRWEDIRAINGVTSFVKLDGIEAIPDVVVEDLETLADSNFVLPKPKVIENPKFRKDDAIYVGGMSVMAGHCAVFDRFINREVAIVMMQWFGKLVPLSVNVEDLVLLTEVLRQSKGKKRRRKAIRWEAGIELN